MSLEIDGDWDQQLFSPFLWAIPLVVYMSHLPLFMLSFSFFWGIYAQFLCWFLLNLTLNGASCLWEGSVGRAGGTALGRLQLPCGFILLASLTTSVVSFVVGAQLSV